jgi:hypothetical protein
MNTTRRQVSLSRFAIQLLATPLILAGQIQVGGDPPLSSIVYDLTRCSSARPQFR